MSSKKKGGSSGLNLDEMFGAFDQ
jgi:ATP-dependent RNA helicase DOB1